MPVTSLKIQLFELQNNLVRKIIELKYVRRVYELTFIGNTYSGYWFPTDLINSQGTIWGVGLGHDSSFEIEMLNKGYQLHGFEPEITCYASSLKQLSGTHSQIYNFGLWDKAGNFEYTGENISIVNIFGKGDFRGTKLRIQSLWDVAIELDLSTHRAPRILRMNIEGAEREILLRFAKEPLPFEILIFQAEFLFHLPFLAFRKRLDAFKELNQMLKQLKKQGWKIIGLNRHQLTLMNHEMLEGVNKA